MTTSFICSPSSYRPTLFHYSCMRSLIQLINAANHRQQLTSIKRKCKQQIRKNIYFILFCTLFNNYACAEKSHAKFASAFNFVKEMVEVWLLSKEWMQNLFEGTSCGPKYAKGTCMHQLQHNVGIVVTKSGIIFEKGTFNFLIFSSGTDFSSYLYCTDHTHHLFPESLSSGDW